jgi:hypothetical protein
MLAQANRIGTAICQMCIIILKFNKMKTINVKLAKLSQQDGQLKGGFLPLESAELSKLKGGGNNCNCTKTTTITTTVK